jgi:hypothetical protein
VEQLLALDEFVVHRAMARHLCQMGTVGTSIVMARHLCQMGTVGTSIAMARHLCQMETVACIILVVMTSKN